MKSKKNEPNISCVQKISNLKKNILMGLNCIGENIAIGKNNDARAEKIVMSFFCDDIKPKRYLYGSWTMHKDVEPLHGPCKEIFCPPCKHIVFPISIVCMPIQIFAYHR